MHRGKVVLQYEAKGVKRVKNNWNKDSKIEREREGMGVR